MVDEIYSISFLRKKSRKKNGNVYNYSYIADLELPWI